MRRHNQPPLVSKLLKENLSQIEFSVTEQASSTLQLIQIYFDTASYDQVLIEPRWTWVLIYWSACRHSLTRTCCEDLFDVTLADEDTNQVGSIV